MCHYAGYITLVQMADCYRLMMGRLNYDDTDWQAFLDHQFWFREFVTQADYMVTQWEDDEPPDYQQFAVLINNLLC